MAESEDRDPLADVPENMREWLREMPTTRPDEYQEGISEAWDKFDRGLCQCCEGPLGVTTTVVMGPTGILACFCSGVCATDMANVGWLQEQHDDLVDRIKFRGGRGDNADE